MTSHRTETETVSGMQKAGPLSLQPSVSDIALYLLVSGLTLDILSTFCNEFLVPCLKLMLSKFLHFHFYCLYVLFVAKLQFV